MIRRESRNRRFALGLLTGALGVALGWGGLIAGQLGRPPVATAWVEQAYAYKLSRAEVARGPRLLIVAGSGAMFGLDSSLLEVALGRPTINLGVNAGIQSLFIQAYARQAIRPGDWVLLPLEYPLYHDRHRMGYAALDYWLSHPGGRKLGLTPWQGASIYWQASLARLLRGYRPDAMPAPGLYGVHNLDVRGDQLHSEAARQQVWMREAVERFGPERYAEAASALQANWQSWKALATQIEAQGGCAIFVPPAMLAHPAYQQGVELAYYRGLPQAARAAGLRYVGEPLDFLYPLDDFFDTNYHLNAEARVRHTERIIKLVRPLFTGQVSGCPTSRR